MKRYLAALSAVFLGVAIAGTAVAASAEQKRQDIDRTATQALERLFGESSKAKALHDKAVGYAVFSITKVSIGITGGGGRGVAVNTGTGERTYMNMGTGGIGLGLGGQAYQLIFLFQYEGTFNHFVETGWEASAQGNAVAGRAGANAEASFINGLAVFQLTEAGLMLQADISGTKYWKSGKLNAVEQPET